MPSRKLSDGTYKDVAHPITMEFREILEKKVFACYEDERRKAAAAVNVRGRTNWLPDGVTVTLPTCESGLPGGVMVTQRTLNPLFLVRVQAWERPRFDGK